MKESRSDMETLKGVRFAMRRVKDWVKGSKDEELAMILKPKRYPRWSPNEDAMMSA